MIQLAERLSLIKPSPTLAVTAQVAALGRQASAVIDFGAGEPDFDTPDHIKAAAVAAIQQGQTKYTPVGGTAAVKEAIIAKLERDNGLSYALSEVTTNSGGKHTCSTPSTPCSGPGDEVLNPHPLLGQLFGTW